MNNLLHLLHLSDPTLPVGGFSHSAGLETYVQYGIVKDKKTAREFITEQLSQNIFYTDAALASMAFNAAQNENIENLIRIDAQCAAIKLAKESRLASQKLGMRLLKIFSSLSPSNIAEQYKLAINNNEAAGHYSVVFAIYASVLGVSKLETLTGFYYNCASAMVTNAVKLIPLGQMEGQQILFSLLELIHNLVAKSLEPNPELLGVCCTGFDIRCMQHERLYSRLYMS